VNLLASLLLVALLMSPMAAAGQSATENAEARVYFQEGNRLYTEASRASEPQRTALLQRALGAYVDSLQIVRSRNALFNAAIVLGELERYDEAFNYFTEYLQIEGLSAEDRDEAMRRRDALRPKVAVLRVRTDPEGALVWIDRKDLAPRGETPVELALPEGDHRLFIEKEGYEPLVRAETMVRGQTVIAELALPPLPVEPSTPAVELESVPAQPPVRARLRLRNAAIGTAAATLATAGVALGLSLRGRTLREDYDRAAAQYQMSGDPNDLRRADYLADRTDRFNLTADVFWGATIGLGVSAIVLYGVHRGKQKREAPELGFSVSREGAFASVRMPWGAAR
jgi:hypothetical protein